MTGRMLGENKRLKLPFHVLSFVFMSNQSVVLHMLLRGTTCIAVSCCTHPCLNSHVYRKEKAEKYLNGCAAI